MPRRWNTQPVAERRRREPGRYVRAGEILRGALRDRGLSRKELADRIGVAGGERTITHWVNGETWPRDPAVRDAMRRVLREAVVDAIENAVAQVMGMPHVEPHERALLDLYRNPSARRAIDAAVERWRRQQ